MTWPTFEQAKFFFELHECTPNCQEPVKTFHEMEAIGNDAYSHFGPGWRAFVLDCFDPLGGGDENGEYMNFIFNINSWDELKSEMDLLTPFGRDVS